MSWFSKAINTVADFTPAGWVSRAVNGKGVVDNIGGLVKAASGQNDTSQPLEQEPFQADPGNQAAAAQAASIKAAQQYQDDISGKNGQMRQAWAQSQPAPHVITDQDIQGEQRANDRAKLLDQAHNQYEPYLRLLAGQSFGNPDSGQPSAAMSTLQAATDRNVNTGYGMAAGSSGTGGQRAALFQAAIGNAAGQNQQAANAATTLRAQEHQQSVANQQQTRSLLSQALGQQTDIYGNLLTDTSNQANENLTAADEHNTNEQKRLADNAAGTQKIVTSVLDTTAKVGAAA